MPKSKPCFVDNQGEGLRFLRWYHTKKPHKGLNKITKIIHNKSQNGYRGVIENGSSGEGIIDFSSSMKLYRDYLQEMVAVKGDFSALVLSETNADGLKNLQDAMRYAVYPDISRFQEDSGYRGHGDKFDVGHVGKHEFIDIAQEYIDKNLGATFVLRKVYGETSLHKGPAWAFADEQRNRDFRDLHSEWAKLEMQTQNRNRSDKHGKRLNLKTCKIECTY